MRVARFDIADPVPSPAAGFVAIIHSLCTTTRKLVGRRHLSGSRGLLPGRLHELVPLDRCRRPGGGEKMQGFSLALARKSVRIESSEGRAPLQRRQEPHRHESANQGDELSQRTPEHRPPLPPKGSRATHLSSALERRRGARRIDCGSPRRNLLGRLINSLVP